MEISLEAKIVSVAVYPDRARVTAQGRLSLEPGLHRLLVDDLPLTLDADSVRAAGRGAAQVRLLNVEVGKAFYEQTPAVRVRELEEAIESAKDELRIVKDGQAGLAAQASYLDGLRQATEAYAKGLARGKTTVEDQARLSQFLQEQDEAVRGRVRSLDQEERTLDRRLNKLRKELKQLSSARPLQRFRVQIEVEVLAGGDFELDLIYVVNRAGWKPLYDIRLLEGEDNRKLQITYIAQVTQQSGQDWQGVALTVSTARPALNQRLPELHPWYLDVPKPPPMPMAAAAPNPRRALMKEEGRVQASLMMADAAPEAEMAEAVVAVAQVQDSGTAVTFSVSGRSDVPSDGSPHKTTINHFELSPELDYVCVPKHTDAVFRRVKVANESASPLLAGPANLFTGDEFIGRTRLDYTPVGEEIELLLGVEERVTVERELVRRDVDKALLRDKRQLRYGYKLSLQNLLPALARIEVQDHIPVSRHEEIKVKLLDVRPQPAEQSELNLMEWRLELAPQAKTSIQFDFQVEHPRSLRVTGLID